MKKKLLFVVLAVMLMFSLVGCTNFNMKLEDAVSEIHEKVLFGKTEEFEATVTVGKVEKEFALEGVKNELKDFVAFRVIPLGDKRFDELTLAYRQNDETVEHDLLENPSQSAWTLTIDGIFDTEKIDLVICDETDEFVVAVEKISMGNFNPLDKLKEKFKNELMNTYRGGKFNCEITLRFVKNRHSDGKFFWFVVVHTGQNDFFGIMIDAETGNILSQKR